MPRAIKFTDPSLKKYEFPWGVLNTILTQKSPIDLKRLAIKNREDAQLFVLNYGYDLEDELEMNEVEYIRTEAIKYIQKYLLEPENDSLNIPPAIQEADVLSLLQLASRSSGSDYQRWACAILRVMHTISHVSNDLSANFFPTIQKQLLKRWNKHIFIKPEGTFLGHDPNYRIHLVEFHVKTRKDRDSAILKLLHKVENVAADIFDRIGVRFVTKDKLDALLVVKYLRENNVVTFPNVKPSRSVNTLINTDKFRKTFRNLFLQLDQGKITQEEFESFLRHDAQFEDLLSERQIRSLFRRNPHTDSDYRSIQFTIRQLVRIPNPLHSYRDAIDEDKINQKVLNRQLQNSRPYYKFFYPYEVQVVDIETHQNNTDGLSSHEYYKNKQLDSARKRVLSGLI